MRDRSKGRNQIACPARVRTCPGFLLLAHLLLWCGCATSTTLRSEGERAGRPPVPATSLIEIAFEDDDDFGDFDDFEEYSDAARGPIHDPLIRYNRFMTAVNDRLYLGCLEPLAGVWRIVVPREGDRLAFNRLFKHLRSPQRLVNHLLQGKVRGGGVEIARFVVNTTLGFGGLEDPAADWLGLAAREEDFGQTLAVWGVGEGFPLVLPFYGPSNLRDALARVPDGYIDPIHYLGRMDLVLGVTGMEEINWTSVHRGEYAALVQDALDVYVLLRDAYAQFRERQIKE